MQLRLLESMSTPVDVSFFVAQRMRELKLLGKADQTNGGRSRGWASGVRHPSGSLRATPCWAPMLLTASDCECLRTSAVACPLLPPAFPPSRHPTAHH
jgi:hypothetical protein